MNTPWLIVGGGIHGVHIAVCLIAECDIAPHDITIIDDGPRLLSRWRAYTATTGMTFLRSPSVHNIGANPWALRQFAGRDALGNRAFFSPPYERPALSLFNRHCDHVIERFGLQARHIQDRVDTIHVDATSAHATLRSGETFESEHVVLAIGAGDQPRWPTWARDTSPDMIDHIFDRTFSLPSPLPWRRVAVVGGGISAVQIAMRLVDAGCLVDLVAPHEARVHLFDSEPGWQGAKYMTDYRKVTSWSTRRDIIREARHAGSMTPSVHRALRRAIQEDAVIWHTTQVHAFEDGVLKTEDASINVDHVLLATGFEPHRPGGAMVDQLRDQHDLPVSPCGFPIVDRTLRWHPRIFVTGPLAELELGPVSRNISGARRAAERIVSHVCGSPSHQSTSLGVPHAHYKRIPASPSS